MVEFVSYDGEYPNLCSGELVLRIEGKEVNLGRYCLHSGGNAWVDYELCDHTEWGAWSVDVPEELTQYIDEITEVVNDNVPWGCCGGCL